MHSILFVLIPSFNPFGPRSALLFAVGVDFAYGVCETEEARSGG